MSLQHFCLLKNKDMLFNFSCSSDVIFTKVFFILNRNFRVNLLNATFNLLYKHVQTISLLNTL